MAKKNDKKTTIILLIILAISIIGGGIWTYDSLKPLEEPSAYLLDESGNNLGISEVFSIKDDIIQNMGDFLEKDKKSGNIWDNFYNNKQFNRLKDIDLNIDIENYSNNTSPFIIPVSDTQDSEQ